MDIQLQELIDKIKKDGIGSAEAAAKDICTKAEADAAAIKAAAEAEAGTIIKKAKEDADRFEKAGIAAIQQAGRNLLLAFREGILKQLGAVVEAGTKASYSDDVLKKLIPETVKSWAVSGTDDISVILPESARNGLESAVTAALSAEIAKGLTVAVDGTTGQGFRISVKDGAAYYDFSAEAVAALFSAYLNPKLAAIMTAAAGEL